MPKKIDPNRNRDYYTQKAKKENYLARSFYKLEELDQKYSLFTPETKNFIDIGCAPGSWLQYASKKFDENGGQGKALGFDLKEVTVTLPHVKTYVQDITKKDEVTKILEDEGIGLGGCDCLVSDMAPDTIGVKDIDALRCIGLVEKTLWMYESYLSESGKFAIKVFMGPGFEELVRWCKDIWGGTSIVVFKPKACRKKSKETYIVKRW